MANAYLFGCGDKSHKRQGSSYLFAKENIGCLTPVISCFSTSYRCILQFFSFSNQSYCPGTKSLRNGFSQLFQVLEIMYSPNFGMLSWGTNETIRFTEIIVSHIKIHHLSMFIHKENENIFLPHEICNIFPVIALQPSCYVSTQFNPKQRQSDIRMTDASCPVNCFDHCFWMCHYTDCTASRVCMNGQRSLHQ